MIRRLDAAPLSEVRARLGEGPVWDHRSGCLLWVDALAHTLLTLDPRTGEGTATDVGQAIGAVALAADGGCMLALEDGFGRLPAGGSVELVAPVERENPRTRMNDGKVDRRGRFWAGTMAWDHSPGAGTLYRLERRDAGSLVTPALGGLTIANGLDWTADGRAMYYIDSASGGVDVFEFDDETGSIGHRRRFIDIPRESGLPDGMTLDVEGCVWVACIRGAAVRRYTPAGRLDCEVALPVTLVTSCAFGGAGYEELYITTARHRLQPDEAQAQPDAGRVFVCRPGTRGRPSFEYGPPAPAA